MTASAALCVGCLFVMWQVWTADSSSSNGCNVCLCLYIHLFPRLRISCWTYILWSWIPHMCIDYILPAAMRKAPPSLHSLWLMKGTPQTKRKPPVRVATRPRIISTVQKPRNTVKKKKCNQAIIQSSYKSAVCSMGSVCIWAVAIMEDTEIIFSQLLFCNLGSC